MMSAEVSTPSGPPRGLARQHEPGLDVASVAGRDLRELHVTVRPLAGESPSHTVRRLAGVLRQHQAEVVRQEVFGSLSAYGEVVQAMHKCLGPVNWPMTFVQGASCTGEALAGLHVLAVAGVPVETVHEGGRPVGRAFRDRWARHVLLGDVRPPDTTQDRPTQARQGFERLEAALRAAGLEFGHVARTWLFLDDILSWYGPLNTVRTDFYRARGVFGRLVPASTGVSGRNLAGAALVAGAWAAEPLNGAFAVREVKSPRQCAATKYGSSFSRAVELSTPELRRLLVSGTASIAPDGRSVCPGDVEAQIDLTMEVVRAILVSRGMDFADGSRVTAYFKRPADARFFEAWRIQHGLTDWPVIYAVADICRDELLFELEMDALAPATSQVP